MSTSVELDDRGVVVACAACGKKNRLAYDRRLAPGQFWNVAAVMTGHFKRGELANIGMIASMPWTPSILR